MQLSNGPFPRRVLCTGAGGGGAYATLCAVWAAVTFPLAQVRHITFGAPAVSTLSHRFHLPFYVLNNGAYATQKHNMVCECILILT